MQRFAVAAGLALLAWAACAAAPWREPIQGYGDEAKTAREIDSETVYPQYAKWIELARKMPRTYSGTVTLDGQPLAGARVTDGLVLVETDAAGRYTIEVKLDTETPYLPARTLCVCWPEGTWPVRDEATGRWQWWHRLMDVRETPTAVDFHLTRRVAEPPLVIAYGTDPHDALEHERNWIMPQEIEQGGKRVHVGMLLGDLMYSNLHKSDAIFSHVASYIRDFPVPYINVMGNHETPQPLFGPHPLAGHGGVTKYLGPIRWSFDIAGVHVVSINYDLVNEQEMVWLEQDLERVPPDRPVYLFTHMWGEYLEPFCERYRNIRFVMSGHSHRTLFCGRVGNAEFWTITNYYRLLYLDGWEWDFIDRRVGEDSQYNFHVHSLGGGRTSSATNVTLAAGAAALPGYAGDGGAVDPAAPFGAGDQYDLVCSATPTGPRPATRFGLRVVNERGYVFPFYYDVPSKTLHMAGRDTYFSPEPVDAAMPRPHATKAVRDAQWAVRMYRLVNPDEREPVTAEAYAQAVATVTAYEAADREKLQAWRAQAAQEKKVSFEINVCPGRVQVFVNGRVSCIQFWRIGKARRIEYFAEGGAAVFDRVAALENGAGYVWKHFDRPVLNQLAE